MTEKDSNVLSHKMFSIKEYRDSMVTLRRLYHEYKVSKESRKFDLLSQIIFRSYVLIIKLSSVTIVSASALKPEFGADFIWKFYQPVLKSLGYSESKELIEITEHLYIGLIIALIKDNSTSSSQEDMPAPFVTYLQHYFYKTRRLLLGRSLDKGAKTDLDLHF